MAEFELHRYPRSRRATFDVGRIGRAKHHIVALVEVDVTEARARVRAAIRGGRKLGFNAWLLKVIADTIAQDAQVQAINQRRRQQVVFRDVDIAVPIERVVDGVKVPLATVVRGADGKTVEAIDAELREARRQPLAGADAYVLERRNKGWQAAAFVRLPQWLRLLVWRALLGSPFLRKQTMGTVMVTNTGLSGSVSGWLVPKSIHNLCFGIGSMTKRPWVVAGEVAVRDILKLTILFDHDAVDGAPAARFTASLVRNLERPLGP